MDKDDKNGHGSYMLSKINTERWGVAKNAQVVIVKLQVGPDPFGKVHFLTGPGAVPILNKGGRPISPAIIWAKDFADTFVAVKNHIKQNKLQSRAVVLLAAGCKSRSMPSPVTELLRYCSCTAPY